MNESPAAIRQAIGQEHYAVTCDECHGHRYIEGRICEKCNGQGQILIHDKRPGRRSFLDLFRRDR